MSNPETQTADTNWTGVSYGIVLGFVAAYFQFKVPPVLPVMIDLYGYEKVVGGGLMSIFAAAGMLVSVRVGRGIRRDGAVRYLAAAFALMLSGTALGLAFPESGGVMLASRAIEGLGAAVLAVCMPAFSNMSAGPKHLPIVIAAQATWIPVGQLVANLVAQPAVAQTLWQPVWWFGAAATLAVAFWTWRIVARDTVPGVAHRPAPAGTADANATGGETAISSAETRALWLAAMLFFLWQAQFMGYFTWFNVYLVEVFAYEADRAVAVNQIPVVVLLIFALIGGVILKTGLGVIRLLTIALGLQTLGWVLIPFAENLAIGLASLVIWGIAAGLTPTSLWALPSTLLGGHRAGTDAFAVVLTGRYLGILAGPMIASGVFFITGEWDTAPYVFAGIALMTILGTWLFGAQMARLRAETAPSRGR
ncbi:MAG: MFS transporter [Alphaproteobacteria bacterium]|nr:MFS transporter [Alphaproteobacteria bacterium]